MHDRDSLPHRILVATDFSESAAAALRRAAELAAQAGAELTVLHVLEEPLPAGVWAGRGGGWEVPASGAETEEREPRRQAEKRLGEWLATHCHATGKVRAAVRVGVPFVETIRAVREGGHDLVVAGTRGLSAFKRFFVGSTAERLVRKCPCPVWIVKPPQEAPLRSILVPVDLGEVSGKALRLAAAIARGCSCSLTVLYVLNFPKDDTPDQLSDEDARKDFAGRRQAARKAAAEQLSRFVGLHAGDTANVCQALAVGVPWGVINRTARRMDADLIVMGSVSRAGLAGFLIGSTAEKVLRVCNRSLLTVKPDGFVSPVAAAT